MQAILTVEPGVEPVTLAEVKAFCDVSRTDQDAMLAGMALGARQWCENYCQRAFIQQTWVMELDRWPMELGELVPNIRLPYPRLISVDSIIYTAIGGSTVSLDTTTYNVTTLGEPGRISRSYGRIWPVLQPMLPAAITITFKAGYGTASGMVPQSIKDAILMLTCHRYEHRSPVEDAPALVEVPMTVKAALEPYVAGDYL